MSKEIKYPEVAKRLSLALSSAGLKPQELAELSDVNKSSISQYMNGTHSPSNISAGKMGEVLGVNPAWLMGLPTPMELITPSEECRVINVLGHTGAGIPVHMITDVVSTEVIAKDLSGKFFGLKVKGDSMSPLMLNGDTLIIRQQPDAETGEIVIVSIGREEAICKRLRKFDGGIELISVNPSYDPMEYSNAEIENLPITILGKVIEVRRRFN